MKDKPKHFAFINRKTAALALVIFAAGALAGRLFFSAGAEHEQASGAHDAAAGAGETVYYCSMHPQVRSPDPNDKCPICFMDLIPLPVDDADDGNEDDVVRLRLSRRAAALMDIRTWPAERRAVQIDVPLYGKLGFDESRLFDVVARTDAYVERLLVNTPWQPVAAGEVLAEFYSPAAVTAFSELLALRGSGAGEGELPAAARGRLLRMGVSDAAVDAVLLSGTVPHSFGVYSPVSGAAMPQTVREGDFLREGTRLTRIADLSHVWLNLEAFERDLVWLKTGMPVVFTVAAYPGRTFEGSIIFIEPVVDDKTRTARVRVAAANPEGLLKPGMLVSAQVRAPYVEDSRLATSDGDAPAPIDTLTNDAPLVIPAAAPLITGRRALVYVRLAQEDRPTFEPRRITLGPRAGDYYIVTEGLAEGALVVVNGQFKIDSELQLRGRPSMMAPEGGAAPAHDHGHADHAGSGAAADTPRLQTQCPVMGGPINRQFYHDHEGSRIYVCCPPCLDEVRARAAEIIEEQTKQGVMFERVE